MYGREMLAVLWFIAALMCFAFGKWIDFWPFYVGSIISVVFAIIYFLSSMYYEVDEEEYEDVPGTKPSGRKEDEQGPDDADP